MAPPTIASGAVRKLLDGARAHGLDVAVLCAEAGTRPDVADDPDARLPLPLLHALWEAVAARRPEPDLALQGARHYRPGDYGLVGFVAASSATLGDGLDAVVRYARLWTDSPVIQWTAPGALDVETRPSMPDRVGLRLTIEAALAELVHGARVLTGLPGLAPAEVRIAHPAPADTTAHDAFFGVAVEFGAARTALAFAPAQLAIALPGHDSQLAAFLRTLARDGLARRAPPDDLLGQVRAQIAERLAHALPDAATVASALAMSERTLRRRLDEAGTSFRAELDTVRAELAASYVRDRRLPLSEVAFLLGFAEQSAFNRAFRRWTGQTPSAARARGG